MHHDASRDAPPTSFIKPHAKDKHGGAAKALFCRNIMKACEAREHGSDSKRKHQVEGIIMQAKEWTRTFRRCTRSRSKMSALEKNRAKRRREVSLPSNSLFLCSSLQSGTTLDLAIHLVCFVQQNTS
jgi:hypothetical protein